MITIYAKDSTKLSGNGLGVLWPESCVITEEANGQYELEMVHPMDDDLRYMLIEVEEILRVPAPKRHTPYAEGLTNTVTYSVIADAALYARPDNTSPELEALTAAQTVTLMLTGIDYHLVSTSTGETGWALNTNLSYVSTVATAPDESLQSWQARHQYFRIYRVEKDTQSLKMRVWARHIFYDLLWRTLRACDVKGLTMTQALAKVEAEAQPVHDFRLYTDATRKLNADLSMLNAVEALLDPDQGLANQGKPRLELVRDNWNAWLLEDGGRTRNDPVMHGRNLIGVTAEVSYDNVINRIYPVGSNEDGTPLYLDSPYYVNSPDLQEGDIIRAKTIEYSDVKVGSEDENEVAYTITTAQDALQAKALAEYTGNLDKPEYNLTVDFVLLGDTEEYEAYRGLDRLYLWDSVQIIDSLHSVLVTADVTGYRYDVLTERYLEMTLGVTSGERGIRLISGYQIRQNTIPGAKLIHQTLGPGQIGPGYMEKIYTNATGQQVTIECTSGVILDEDNTSTIATLKVWQNGIDISDLIPASAVHWERISDDTAGDAVWNADPAHIGTKTVTINAVDVDWRGVLRCSMDEVRLYSTPTMVDGELILEDVNGDDANLFELIDGELVYTGPVEYLSEDGALLVPQTIGAFTIDTQLSNLKTSYINITRAGIEVYGSGFVDIKSGGSMDIEAGGAFNLRAGTGSKSIGMSNNHIDEYFMWAGHGTPASAPFRVMMDGRVYATNLQQVYSQSFWDMADDVIPATFEIYVPSGYTMDSVAFTFKTGKARTFAKAASSGGGSTSGSGGGQTSGSGGAQTSSDGGGSTVTSAGIGTLQTGNSGEALTTDGATSTMTTDAGTSHSHNYGTLSADIYNGSISGSTGSENAHTHGFSHEHYIGVHNHLLTSHTHSVTVAAHNHTVADHTHSVADHSHSTPDHTHGLDYGINEKTKLATSCVLKVNGTTIGTYSPDPASLLEIKAYLTGGAWNTITVQPDDDARITAYAMVKITAA
jgi:phage minor structural protein